jgi:hypothetical protein
MIQIGSTKPQLKFFEQCKPGELVRGKFFEKTEWALIANRNNELQNVVLFADDQAPRGFNAFSRGDIMQVSCLTYGDKLDIVPEYDGPCDVGFGLQADLPGQLILTENDLVLVTTYANRIGYGYFYETTKEIKGSQPGGQMAVFSKWSIWIRDLFGYPNPSKLLEGHASSAAKS